MATNELELGFQQQQNGGVMAQTGSSREMEEVKGQIFMAKQFPRNVFQAEQRILDACKRPSLAQSSMYQYPKGGAKVTGPSIRLAEVLAQNWGNIDFGIKELEQKSGESSVMAYAWDLETNTRQTKVFTVKHSMKAHGKLKALEDPRDIYEKVANDGARRLRSCILGVIPGDIVDTAVGQCQKTLAGQSDKPLKDRILELLKSFKNHFGVTQEQIEERFGYKADSFTEYDIINARNIYNSLKDGMSKVSDWFGDKKQDSKKKEDKPNDELVNAFEESEKGDKTNAKSSGSKDKKAESEQGELPFD